MANNSSIFVHKNYESIFADNSVHIICYCNHDDDNPYNIFVYSNAADKDSYSYKKLHAIYKNGMRYINGRYVNDIIWVARFDNKGNLIYTFNRDKDIYYPLPELKTGMIVEVDEINRTSLAIIVGEYLVYQDSDIPHRSSICDVKKKIIRIWDTTVLNFGCCRPYNAYWTRGDADEPKQS